MALPVKEFIKQRLLEFDPTFDVGNGIATTSLLIDPLAIVLQPIRDEVDQVKLNQSILTIESQPDPDLFPEDVVDAIASNFIVTRKPGGQSQVTLRIRFFEPQDFSEGAGLLTGLGSTGTRFVNKDAVNISSSEMALNQEGTLFFVDVIFIASDVGERFNIPAGDIQALENAPEGVVSVTNPLASDNLGRNKETNTQLLQRVRVAITVRALVTGRGIISLLTESFSFLEEVTPIGFGDVEMMRDIRFNTHIGGNSDVYVKTPIPNRDSQDFFGLLVDPTRRVGRKTSLVALITASDVSVGFSPIDDSVNLFVAKGFSGVPTFTEGVAYSLDRVNGLFQRLDNGEPGVYPTPSSPTHIYHNVVSVLTGQITASNIMTDLAGTLTFAKKGMILTVATGPQAGTYLIKQPMGAFAVKIYGVFKNLPAVPPFPIFTGFQIDEHVSLTYDYNPVAIDVIKTPRTGREAFTITRVPELLIDSIERLDPITGEPTGDLLDRQGGYGSGGYGTGGYGTGSPGDWQYVVTQPTLRFSAKEDNLIRFASSLAGIAARVSFRQAVEVQDLQAFCDDALNRSETASLLVRHFVPIFVRADKPITFRIRAGASATTDEEIVQAISDFIEGVRSGVGQKLEKSDLVDLIYELLGGQRSNIEVDLDWKLLGDIQHEDGTVEFVAEDVTGVLIPPTPPPTIPPLKETSRPFSPRIAHFSLLDIAVNRITV